MNIKQAMGIAQAPRFVKTEWDKAKALLIQQGLCPHCACDGERSKLKPVTGDAENHSGFECEVCEDFFAVANEPEPSPEPGLPDQK